MTDYGVNIDQLGTYSDGYLAGGIWGIAHATAQTDERDERLARRIVALLLQHEANGDLTAWVTSMKPYAERGIPRVIASHDLWPGASNPDDWTDEPTPDPT